MDILVDLDGTLVDPAIGIIRSFQAGLQAVDSPPIAAETLPWIIGPPLRLSYAQAGVAAADGGAALAAYRATYRSGAMFEVTPYRGIAEALATLGSAGHRLIVATSKPHVFAKPILESFDLARHFSSIYGSELDGRNDDKGDLIARIIATERVDTRRALMIGDRKFDCVGAKKNGIRSLGVLWGYGGEDELRAAGALVLAKRPQELPALIAPLV